MQRIPSIHNYCNRWCERCPFQVRCAFYLAKNDDSGEIDWSEGTDRKFANSTPHPFQTLDLDQAEALQKRMEAREKAGPFDLEKAPLTLLYQHWHKDYRAILEQLKLSPRIKDLSQLAYLETKEQLLLDNALQVMNHYQTFIGPKIARALGGKHDEMNIASSPQSDWNGTAKVATLALKHLRLAFEDLMEMNFLDRESILQLLGQTNRLIRLMYFEFPELDAFKRPGFDTVDDIRLRGKN